MGRLLQPAISSPPPPAQVGRLLQPAIIWIDNAERTFVKKVPKTDRTEPRRLKKELPKLLKTVTAADRILLVGTSETPWDADQKVGRWGQDTVGGDE